MSTQLSSTWCFGTRRVNPPRPNLGRYARAMRSAAVTIPMDWELTSSIGGSVVARVLPTVVLRVVVRVVFEVDPVQDRAEEFRVCLLELVERPFCRVATRHFGADDKQHAGGAVRCQCRVRHRHDRRGIDDDPIEMT